MDSTPTPIPHPHSNPLSLQSPASKLPIKRKFPKLDSPASHDDGGSAAAATDPDLDTKPPPFKFHRIWTEPEEIRFLQNLLDCSSLGLSFPRDLHIFYSRFSDSMSLPYTKSQLYEKLRRLKKKFRVISSRLARGLDQSVLSPHDRDLFELSKKLWSPEFLSASPFGNRKSNLKTSGTGSNSSGKKIDGNLVGVKVSFSPTLPFDSYSNENQGEFLVVDNDDGDDDYVKISEVNVENDADDVKIGEVNVEYDFGGQEEELCGVVDRIGGVVAKSVMDAFDRSLKEVQMVLVRQGLLHPDHSSNAGKGADFERRWREQRAAELDVLARRLRLVLENSLNRQ